MDVHKGSCTIKQGGVLGAGKEYEGKRLLKQRRPMPGKTAASLADFRVGFKVLGEEWVLSTSEYLVMPGSWAVVLHKPPFCSGEIVRS